MIKERAGSTACHDDDRPPPFFARELLFVVPGAFPPPTGFSGIAAEGPASFSASVTYLKKKNGLAPPASAQFVLDFVDVST